MKGKQKTGGGTHIYRKIWLWAAGIAVLLCTVFVPVAGKLIEDEMLLDGGDPFSGALYIRDFVESYLLHRTYLSLSEDERENAANAREMEDNERTWAFEYELVGNANFRSGTEFWRELSLAQMIRSFGASLGKSRLKYDWASAMWVADRKGNLILPGDYVAFQQGPYRYLLADARDCLGEEEWREFVRLCREIPRDQIEMSQYALRDGIAYPMILTVTTADGETITWIGKPPFEAAEEEIVRGAGAMLWDVPADPEDPLYLLAQEYAEDALRAVGSGVMPPWTSIAIDWRESIVRFPGQGKFLKVTARPGDDLIFYRAGICDFSAYLLRVRLFGCAVILLGAAIVAGIACARARSHAVRAEYERTVTNALAHDYKSSLMIQRSYAENLREGVPEEKKRLYEQKIIGEIDRMDERTERLLSVFRTGEPRAGREEEVDLGALARERIREYEPLSEERGLSWKIEEQGRWVRRADRELLGMALGNLFGNACKYARADTEVRVEIRDGRLSITNEWEPVEKFRRRPRLFWEPYTTGDEARSGRGGGIGLYVTREILRRMGLGLSARAGEERVTFEVRGKGATGR